MKIYDIVALFETPLSVMYRNNIDTSVVRYLPLYRDYFEMKCEGLKMTYIVAKLCDKYGIRRSRCFDIIRLFERSV